MKESQGINLQTDNPVHDDLTKNVDDGQDYLSLQQKAISSQQIYDKFNQ